VRNILAHLATNVTPAEQADLIDSDRKCKKSSIIAFLAFLSGTKMVEATDGTKGMNLDVLTPLLVDKFTEMKPAQCGQCDLIYSRAGDVSNARCVACEGQVCPKCFPLCEFGCDSFYNRGLYVVCTLCLEEFKKTHRFSSAQVTMAVTIDAPATTVDNSNIMETGKGALNDAAKAVETGGAVLSPVLSPVVP
jgi:hypothetical protein